VEAVSLNQKKTLTEQEESIGKLKLERVQFQHQSASAQDEAKSARGRLLIAEQKIPQITWERDRLQAALTNSVAISLEQARRLQETQSQLTTTQQRCAAVESELTEARQWIERLTTQLQATRLKFSELTTNHDVLVARYNSLTAQFNATSAPAMSPLQ
jgi:chromosome segregation ATPase